MEISGLVTDDAILVEIGARLSRRRLELQLTQAEVAEQAGIAKRTLERIEAGASAQMSSMVRLLRVLDLLAGLDQMIPAAGPGPMALLQDKGRVRQRASSRQREIDTTGSWSWDDEA
jgi:transcriptional regulator with XRE-family HTH domain